MSAVPEVSLTNPSISSEERARRLAAVNFARGSVRLEGFVIGEKAELLGKRYVDGEITLAEFVREGKLLTGSAD